MAALVAAAAALQWAMPAVATDVTPWINNSTAAHPQDLCPGYMASAVTSDGNGGLTANLDLAGPACNVFGTDVAGLTLNVEYQADDRVHVEIVPRHLAANNASWFLVPEELVPKPAVASGSVSSDLAVSWTNDPTFSFTVTRKSTGDVIFTTKGSKLVFEDQFLEFASSLPDSYNLYGLGEVIQDFRLGVNNTRTLYNADTGDAHVNIYGTHPIYLDTRYFDSQGNYVADTSDADKSAQYTSYTHGVFLRNTHGQEALLRPSNITWRTIGGSIDLYFYSGPSAESVIKAYQQSTVGLPAMQQYWAFGFHQCRWGYKNWSMVEDVVASFKAADIPLETIWTDIDYMNQYRDFENDQVTFNYSRAALFLAELHENDQHYVPIVDSAIYVPDATNASDAYPPFDCGFAADAFMLNPDGSLYIGEVWPGYTVYPDWIGAVLNGTSAFSWWADELELWHQNVSFDGIWIDMSEVSSFCEGSCGTPYRSIGNHSLVSLPYNEQDTRDLNSPPYVIDNTLGSLGTHVLSPNATHHGGIVDYDTHNIWGHQILNATHSGLLSLFPEKRPFIIGRSTFAGSGKWAGHWGGDNYSKWEYMVYSIAQALSFSMFGIPMFGPDTCGFNDDTTEELCSRWMQLSAFFPFYRNHNQEDAISQEPYRWSSVASASRTAMAVRYSLLPYMYTLFAEAHATGSTVMRALEWEFPNEPWLAGAYHQFLLGPALLVTPCLEEGATTVNGVFPGSGHDNGNGSTVWYDWYNQTAVSGSLAPGANITIDAPLGHIPLYVRGGYVLATQEAAMTTTAARRSPWSVLVALDASGSASGSTYLDDGESLNPSATTWVVLEAGGQTLTASTQGSYADASPLANVTVMGVSQTPTSVTWNNQSISSSQWTYDSASQLLQVTGLSNSTAAGAWAQPWTLAWK